MHLDGVDTVVQTIQKVAISCERQAFQKVVRQEEVEAEAEPAAGTAGGDVCPRVDTIGDCMLRSLLNKQTGNYPTDMKP